MAEEITRITPENRLVGDPTPGMVREQALAVDGLWAGFVRTEPHMTSGWHHHGDYDTCVYVVTGAVLMESGPDGATVVEAHPGDFLFVPKGVVHREGNPLDSDAAVVVTRAGTGPPTVNVDGPDAA